MSHDIKAIVVCAVMHMHYWPAWKTHKEDRFEYYSSVLLGSCTLLFSHAIPINWYAVFLFVLAYIISACAWQYCTLQYNWDCWISHSISVGLHLHVYVSACLSCVFFDAPKKSSLLTYRRRTICGGPTLHTARSYGSTNTTTRRVSITQSPKCARGAFK